MTEVNSTTRMKFLGKKMKLGWNMCNVDDYIKVNRCYKCVMLMITLKSTDAINV